MKISEYQNIRISKYPNIKIPGYQNTGISKYPSLRCVLTIVISFSKGNIVVRNKTIWTDGAPRTWCCDIEFTLGSILAMFTFVRFCRILAQHVADWHP